MTRPHPDDDLVISAGELDAFLDDVLTPAVDDEVYRAGRHDGATALHYRILNEATIQ